MKTIRAWALRTLSAGAIAMAAAAPCQAQGDQTLTEDGVIKGTMDIEFKTRTQLDTSDSYEEGSPQLGVKDTYKFSYNVAKTTEYAGEITRTPVLYSKTLRRKQQSAEYNYDVTLSVLNPNDLKQKRTVGKWVGQVPVDTVTGAIALEGGRAAERPLRIVIDTVGAARGFTDNFGGRIMGKSESKKSLASYTYKRLVGGKTVELTVKQVDPMRFEGVQLAKGPAEIYPKTTVRGRLDYDYETGNWLTDGIRMAYTVNGKEHEDVITGSIKFVEDPQRATNGKSHYEFNLRFNEDKNKQASSESAAFTESAGEDAFFVVDDTMPCLTGRVDYVDTFAPGSGEDMLPASSKVTYELNANKLTKQQIMNFFKLWILCIGPTNDE